MYISHFNTPSYIPYRIGMLYYASNIHLLIPNVNPFTRRFSRILRWFWGEELQFTQQLLIIYSPTIILSQIVASRPSQHGITSGESSDFTPEKHCSTCICDILTINILVKSVFACCWSFICKSLHLNHHARIFNNRSFDHIIYKTTINVISVF